MNHVLLACVVYVVFLVYGSLVPLHWTPQPLAAAWAEFLHLPGPQWRAEDRVDVAVNFLLLVPLAFGLSHLALAGRAGVGRWLAQLMVWPASAALSVGIEFAQTFFPPRDPSWTDVAAQWAGAAVGIAAYALAGGRFRALLDGLAPSHSWQARCRRWLVVYLGLMVAFSVMPLDLTLNPVELYRKWRAGGVILVPFGAPWPGAWQFTYDFLTDIALWIPPGVLWCIDGTGRRFGAVVRRGLLAAALLECAQLLVLSRVSDVTDVLLAGVGVALGARVPALLRGWSSRGRLQQRRWLGAAALVWCGIAVTALWSPFDFTPSGLSAATVVDVLTRLPFQTYFFRGEFGALNEIVRKLLVFLPGGLLVAAWAARLPGHAAGRRALFGLWLLAFVLEAGQLLLPSKVADLTDALLGCLGAWVGWRIGRSLDTLSASAPVSSASHPAGVRGPASAPPPIPAPAAAIWLCGGLAMLIWLAARVPGLPYNVAKLVPGGIGGVLSAVGVAFALWWILAAPLLLLKEPYRRWGLALPVWLLLHGLVAFGALRMTVPLEMLHKVIGNPVLGWWGPWEDIGRYLALHACVVMPIVGAMLIVRVTQQPATLVDLLNWVFIALLLFWPLHAVVVDAAATDNLVELMRGGGGILASLALTCGWGLVVLAGAALAAAAAGGRWRAMLGLAAGALAAAPWVLAAGLEPVLVKYGKAFSALQFIVSAGRDRYATGGELHLRAGIALLGLGLLVAALQFLGWRALRAADADAGKRNRRGGLAAA